MDKKRVLEIGVGLRDHPDTTDSIDKSPDSIAKIIRDVAKRGLPFEDDTFDKVYSYEILEHIESYEDLIFLINEIWRVLIPGGTWSFSVPNGGHAWDHITHVRFFTKEAFKYYDSNLPDDYEYMRKTDGIIARFGINWIDNSGSLLGYFKAIK